MFFHASHEEKDVTNHFFGEVSCQDTTKLYKKGPLSAASANFPFCFHSAHFCFLLPLSFVVSSPICVNNTKSFLCTMWFLSRPNNFLKFFIRCKKQFNDFLPAKQDLHFSIDLFLFYTVRYLEGLIGKRGSNNLVPAFSWWRWPLLDFCLYYSSIS